MKKRIVSLRARALMVACALFIFATNSHAGGRTEVYAHYPESGYTEHIGTVYYNSGWGCHCYTDSWQAAYGFYG